MLEPGDLSQDHRQVLRVLRSATLTSTRNFRNGPVYRHLIRELARIGVRDGDTLLRDLAPDYVVFDPPIADGMSILLTARGWHAADRYAPEIHAGLIPAVRACFDRFWQARPTSPTEAGPLRLGPGDLWPADCLPSKSELFVVGLLLEIERVGRVIWTGDPASPWRVELDAGVGRFARVGDYESFLAAADGGPQSLAIAS